MKANELEIPIHVGTRCVSASGQPFIVLQVDDNSGMLLVRNENSGNEAQISTEGFEKALLDERTRNQAKEPESSQIPDSNEELVSRIEEELRKKQEGKEYKDVWVRVSGARKEDAAIKRLLTAEDLGKLDSATAYEKTNKKNVLGEYNPTADKESGTSAGVVYMRKALFSAIPSKPSEDSSEARRKYVEQLPKIWGAILEINTLSALKDYGRSRFMSSWTSSGKIYDNQADDGARFDASDALGKKFMNLLRRASTSATAIWNEAEKCESHTTEQVDEMYEKYKKNQEITMKRLLDDMGETPKPEFRDYVAVQLKRLTGKKPVGEALELEVNRLHRLRVEWIRARCAILPRDEYCRVYSIREGGEGNFAFLEEKKSTRSSSATPTSGGEEEAKDTLRIHNYIPLLAIERSGGREVSPEEIKDNETLIKNFGYKAVEYGNWVRDDEARHHVSNYIASMKDLEDVLGISIKDVNLYGKLSVSFGSRGRAGMMASYDLRRRHINLTKMLGDGSVAHEFGHFLDHVFASQGNEWVSMISGGDKFRSASQWTDTPLYRAMRDVMDSIVQGDYVVKKKFSYAGESIPSYTEIENIGVRNKGNPVAAAEEMRRHGWFKREYWLCLSKALGTEVEMIRKTGHTEFFFNAENMSSNYWSRPCELFARAFEAYIQDKLTAAGMMNNYLVADNLPTAEGKRMGLSKNYPQGAEREKINAKIDILVGEIRNALSKV